VYNYSQARSHEPFESPTRLERIIRPSWLDVKIPRFQLGLVVSFGFALLLNQHIQGRGLFGALFYIPTVIPAVAAAWMWKLLMTKNSGLVNAALSLIRPGTAIPWLHQYAFHTLILLSLWGIGGSIIIFLAALQAVPQELEEAALIDGASRLQMFRFITVPLVTPVVFLQLVMGIIQKGTGACSLALDSAAPEEYDMAEVGGTNDTMARVYSGWDGLGDDEVQPWPGEDEALIASWLGDIE
jgi:ABC-type polysaccharide transport system permease subunit